LEKFPISDLSFVTSAATRPRHYNLLSKDKLTVHGQTALVKCLAAQKAGKGNL
jgi:hypothetical protein